MYFNSITFLIFLIVVFIVFWKTISFSNKTAKLTLLFGSYIFYGWWDWRFLILILISSLVDFVIGIKIFESKEHKSRKRLLLLSILVNIGILFFFKYFNFFIDSFESLFGIVNSTNNWNSLNIILPVGISFYTFQTMSYSIDIYRQKIEPTRSALTFFTFVAFFPQLVAGPIERAQHLIPQFEKKFRFDFDQASSGLKLIIWGLFKKMVIADQLAVIVNAVYASPANFSGWSIVAATFLFGFQIYCDFSGYSEIAIGTARLFGIELMANFKTPYFSNSFRGFWHRWHISLSTWFRDYVYIPLGGNRGTEVKWIRNIVLTFTISGLWHGANLTFILWGFLHGLFYAAERYLTPIIRIQKKIKNMSGFIITFLLVNLAWLFFRAENITIAKQMLQSVWMGKTNDTGNFVELIKNGGHFTEPGRVLIFVFPLFIITELIMGKKEFSELLNEQPTVLRWAFYYLIVFAILFLGVLNSAPQFIYFQF